MSPNPASPPPPPLPTSMRAWTFTSRGSPLSVLTLTQIPIPSPSTLSADEVLIKVSHVGIHPALNVFFHLAPHFTSNPWVPEFDFSGWVVAVGSGVPLGRGREEFEIGGAVCGAQRLPDFPRRNGALAEYLVCNVESLVRKPAGLSFAEASGFAANGMTGVQATNLAGLRTGGRVLVTGGSGGLGHLVVQVCRAVVGEEGWVVATCSERNREMVLGLGADEVVDYTKHERLHEYMTEHYSQEPFDVIFDVVGDAGLHKYCPRYLKPDGWFILLGAMGEIASPSWWGMLSTMIPAKLERFRPVMFGGVPRNHRMMNGGPDKETLLEAVRIVEEGKLKVVIDSVWEMEDMLKGYEKGLTGRAQGKIICKVVAGPEE